MMAVTLHDWRTIRELRLCTAAGLINPMEFKILLAPQIFLDQGSSIDDDDDDEAPQVDRVAKTEKKSKKEGPIGFNTSSEEGD